MSDDGRMGWNRILGWILVVLKVTKRTRLPWIVVLMPFWLPLVATPIIMAIANSI